jgi:hypothetical protein
MILANRQVAVDELAHHLCISHGFGHAISTGDMCFIKFVKDGFQNNSQEIISAHF